VDFFFGSTHTLEIYHRIDNEASNGPGSEVAAQARPMVEFTIYSAGVYGLTTLAASWFIAEFLVIDSLWLSWENDSQGDGIEIFFWCTGFRITSNVVQSTHFNKTPSIGAVVNGFWRFRRISPTV
jgi:hypothetical protein